MRNMVPKLIAIGLLLLPFSAMSHHSGPAVYDPTKIGEVEGVVTKLLWRNPHVSFTLRVTDKSGKETSWLVEGNSPSRLKRRGVTKGQFKVSTPLKVAGQLARSGEPRLRVTNVLLPTGEELLLLNTNAPLRWNTGKVLGTGNLAISEAAINQAKKDAYSIFRVWTFDPTLGGRPEYLWEKDYPLTEYAAKYRAEYDPDKDTTLAECTAPGMPSAMALPYPMDFAEEGDTVVMRQEAFDVRRIFHMAPDAGAKASQQTPSILGYSVGHWEGKTLVVETSRIDWPYFDQRGLPQGKDVTLVERFKLSNEDSRLDYEMVVTDPAIFTEPVTLSQYWVWAAGETVDTYDCQMYDPIKKLMKKKMEG